MAFARKWLSGVAAALAASTGVADAGIEESAEPTLSARTEAQPGEREKQDAEARPGRPDRDKKKRSRRRRGPPQILFDDFSYASPAELERNGWILRTAPGWPGVPGATWADNVTVGVTDPDDERNRLMRLTASTDGKMTRQAQFCHQRKYYEGTYAARVRWSDGPISGPDGDQIVQTFYLIAPLRKPMDADYSEVDFEYLPNGGWGSPERTLFVTTWETFRPEPDWHQVNISRAVEGISREGWHVLVALVADRNVTYYIDDDVVATHGGDYFPEEPMSINFNLWFIRDELVPAREMRRYEQEVDWVYHEVGRTLAPAEVRGKVADFRRAGVAFRDSVPPWRPRLDSPCNF